MRVVRSIFGQTAQEETVTNRGGNLNGEHQPKGTSPREREKENPKREEGQSLRTAQRDWKKTQEMTLQWRGSYFRYDHVKTISIRSSIRIR